MSGKLYCKRVRMLMRSDDVIPSSMMIARVRCKQWECPACSQANKNQWKRHLVERFSHHPLNKTKWCFMTLTLPPYMHKKDPAEGVSTLQKGWKRLYDLLRRKYALKLSYVYFYEHHKSGTYHLHCIINLGDDYDRLSEGWDGILDHHPIARWLRDTLPTIKLGWKCDIRRVYAMNGLNDAISAVMYAIKYISKSSSWRNFKKHARRVGVTSDIGSPKRGKSEKGSWRPVPFIVKEDLQYFDKIIDVSRGHVLKIDDFEHGMYPREYEQED